MAEIEERRNYLRGMLPPGSTVYTKLVHCSRSGMYRAIDLYVMIDNEPIRISHSVAKAIDGKYDQKHEAVGISGCGMDMGFAIVYDLSYSLYHNGFTCTGKECPSNDHSNGDRNYTPHQHKSGGYALKHRWF